MEFCSDLFGMNNLFIRENKVFNGLSKEIVNNGFSDFSPAGLSLFLSFRYPVLGTTMFSNILRIDCPFDCNQMGFSTNTKDSLEAAKERIETMLLDSVQKHVGNAKRIGILLSGGLDSSLLCAMCARLYPDREIYSYSIGFKGDDEFEYSSKVSQQFNTKHYKKVLQKNDFFGEDSLLKSLIKQKAAPLHPNELPLAIAGSKARLDLCDCVLCGEGSDDIFGGYGQLLRMYLTYNGNTLDFYKQIMNEYRYFSIEKITKLLRDEYIVSDIEIIKKAFIDSETPHNLPDYMLYFIQRIHTRGLVERAANALLFSGFRPSFVYLDSALVSYVNSLPFAYKVQFRDGVRQECIERELNSNGYRSLSDNLDIPKFILKLIAKDYLSDEIIYRRKKGFPVPFNLWDKNENFSFNLNQNIFKTKDISFLNGWEKFMIYNLNCFIEIFEDYKT